MTTPAPAPAATVPGCPHSPPCPAADAVDHDAARVVAEHHDQGWIELCNGVIVFDDDGELVPDASKRSGCRAVMAEHWAAPHCDNPNHAHCRADDDRWRRLDEAGRAFLAETKEAA